MLYSGTIPRPQGGMRRRKRKSCKNRQRAKEAFFPAGRPSSAHGMRT